MGWCFLANRCKLTDADSAGIDEQVAKNKEPQRYTQINF